MGRVKLDSVMKKIRSQDRTAINEATIISRAVVRHDLHLEARVSSLLRAADSVSVCLSKGLGAPVGSVVVGSKSFIAKARRLRKTLGGGMRQISILCAAALVALRDNVGNLATDHKNAKLFADGLNQIKGLRVDGPMETNIIFIEIEEGSGSNVGKICKSLEDRGILLMSESIWSNLLLAHCCH
ncbi:hypothetical protein RIF29_00690 [Crotalaria pallida]|uniref:Aromatic amino acid beta-eliminating lyase/threonine aldolase domain-containing protein n=1 Tax=Crotalaria pallida TaxID=3830 RepID=A0AAN9IVV0_CROPI